MLGNILKGAPTDPIQYVGGYVRGFDGTTSNVTITFGGDLTGGLSSSAAIGDIVVVGFAISSGGSSMDTNPTVSGYTELVEVISTSSNSSTRTTLNVAYKVLTAADTSFVLTGGTGSSFFAGVVAVQVWRNVNSTTPFDVTSTTSTLNNTSNPNPPSITPVTNGAVVIAVGSGSHESGAFSYTSSDLSNFITVGRNDTFDAMIGMGSYNWISGAFDPAQFSGGPASTGAAAAAVTMALRPE